MADIIEFDDLGNYRGCLQITEGDGKFFARVDCDLNYGTDHETDWEDIPQYLFDALTKYANGVDTTKISET